MLKIWQSCAAVDQSLYIITYRAPGANKTKCMYTVQFPRPYMDMIISAWVADEGLQWLSLLGISFTNSSTWSIFIRALDNSDESNQEQKLESILERPAGNVASCKRNAAFKNSSPGIALFKKAAHTSAIASLSMRRQAGERTSGIERFRWAVKRVMQYKALTGYKLSDSCNRSSSAPVMSGNLLLCDS